MHYWNHRDHNCYVHVVYDDQVADKGAAGLCATTYISRNTLIVPYVGITKSRRHSSAYTVETTYSLLDAADIVHDYGYYLFSSSGQTYAPPNVARFANSLRDDQRSTVSFNSRLGESSACAGFDAIWLIATKILPGEGVLCDYGCRYLLPNTAPQHPTPLTQSSQADIVLTCTSTGTLIDNLRPLGLYEIIRKMLAAIIIKRAYQIWEKLQLLDPMFCYVCLRLSLTAPLVTSWRVVHSILFMLLAISPTLMIFAHRHATT